MRLDSDRQDMSTSSSAGRLLEALGVAHAAVGLAIHRRAIRSILSAGLVDTVGDHGDRATAFWFLMAAPMLWSSGRLLRSAAGTADARAQRDAGLAVAGAGLAGVAMMPRSPFWLVAGAGISAAASGARRLPQARNGAHGTPRPTAAGMQITR